MRATLFILTPFLVALLTSSCATSPDNEWDPSFADKADGFGDCVLDSGESGECMDTADCAAAGGTSHRGYCPGASNIRCCVQAGSDDGDSPRDDADDDGFWDDTDDDDSWDDSDDGGFWDDSDDDGSRDEPDDDPPPRESSYRCTFYCFHEFRLHSSWDCHGENVGEVETLETSGSTMQDAYYSALDRCDDLFVDYRMGSVLCDWWSWDYESRITQQRYYYYVSWADRARPGSLDSVCRSVGG